MEVTNFESENKIQIYKCLCLVQVHHAIPSGQAGLQAMPVEPPITERKLSVSALDDSQGPSQFQDEDMGISVREQVVAPLNTPSQPPDEGEIPLEVEATILEAKTIDEIYVAMEALHFPESETKAALGDAAALWIEDLRESLQLPFESVFLALIALSAFAVHKTETMYTSMLSLPSLPWFAHLGRTGDGKSIIVWLQKQVVLERQDRINRRLKQLQKAQKQKQKEQQTPAKTDSSDDEDNDSEGS